MDQSLLLKRAMAAVEGVEGLIIKFVDSILTRGSVIGP